MSVALLVVRYNSFSSFVLEIVLISTTAGRSRKHKIETVGWTKVHKCDSTVLQMTVSDIIEKVSDVKAAVNQLQIL